MNPMGPSVRREASSTLSPSAGIKARSTPSQIVGREARSTTGSGQGGQIYPFVPSQAPSGRTNEGNGIKEKTA